jgi:hypothetical protein
MVKHRLSDTIDPTYNWKWHHFMLGIMNGENRYLAYCKAFGIDPDDKSKYATACVSASQLLRKPKFQTFWTEYLEANGFNDAEVDQKLLELMDAEEKNVALGAIKHYNELRGRVIKRLDHTNKGEKFETPQVIDMGGEGFVDEDKQEAE